MLCVIAKIDADAKARLRRIQQLAERFHLPPRPLYGHVTLATYLGDEEDAFIASCKLKLSTQPAFQIRYERLDVFSATSILVAVPAKSHDLVTLQRSLAFGWTHHLDRWTQPEVWCPHTTLLHSEAHDLAAVAEALRPQFVPFLAQVNQIEFSRVYENSYEIIDSFTLTAAP